MVAVCESRFPFLAAELSAASRHPTLDQLLTSSPKTRVGVSRCNPSGRMSRRARRHPINTPGSRACAYKTASGRANWPNRDPIGEADGPNVYACVHNNPINYVDSEGRQIFPPYQPPPPRPPPNKPNEENFYNVHYSKNTITLNFHACCNCDELRDRLYADLKTFKNWGNNSVASINVYGNTASFYPGLGAAAGGGLAGNDANWRVRLSNDDSTHCVSARTLDDHPLVGVRKWCASLSKQRTSCVITITTEAYERPRNWQNYLGGQWFGRNNQRQIWEDYLGNVAGAYKDDACFQSSQRGTPVQRDTGSTTNPWVP